MQLSTKVRYGIRAMLEIALQYDGTPVMASSIAEKQALSRKYLENLLNMLRVNGLVKSVRGSKGGYILSKDPKDITLEEIVIALDGPLAITPCVEAPKSCEFSDSCVTYDLWVDMTDLISNYLKGKSLKTLIDNYNQKQGV
jgi:Rrf2 family protein